MHSVMRVETLDYTLYVCVKCGCDWEQFSGPDSMGCFEVRQWHNCDDLAKTINSHKLLDRIEILWSREHGECMGKIGLVKDMDGICLDCGLEYSRIVFTWERGGDLISTTMRFENDTHTCSQWRMRKALE